MSFLWKNWTFTVTESACQQRKRDSNLSRSVQHVHCQDSPEETETDTTIEESIEDEDYPLLQLSTPQQPVKPLEVAVMESPLPWKFNCWHEASVLIVSENTGRHHWPDEKLQNASTKLHTYSGEGNMEVQVHYGEWKEKLLLINSGTGCGPKSVEMRLVKRLDCKEIHKIVESPLQSVLQKHKVVFKKELGTLIRVMNQKVRYHTQILQS